MSAGYGRLVNSMDELAAGGDRLVYVQDNLDGTVMRTASSLSVGEAARLISRECLYWVANKVSPEQISDELIASSLECCTGIGQCGACVWGQFFSHDNDDSCIDTLSREAAKRLKERNNDGRNQHH